MPGLSRFQNPLPVNILRGIVPTASGWDGQIGFAYLDDGGVFTDDTIDANSAAANDVPLMPAVEAVNDAFYFGDTNIAFNQIKINLGTSGVGGTIAWEYYNGATWVALSVSDLTLGFTAAPGTYYVTFTAPANWAKVVVNGQNAYWVRARVTAANFTTIPLATQIWLGAAPTNLVNATDGSFSTVTGTGTINAGAAMFYGHLIFDLGAVKTFIIGGRVGIWSSANIVYAVIQVSDDNNDYHHDASSPSTTYSAAGTTTTERVMHLTTRAYNGRYIKISFYVSGAAATVNAKIYEVMAYELGV